MRYVLIDSSAILHALVPALDPTLAGQLPSPGHDTTLCRTQYLRQEFLRRWICTGIELYAVACRSGSLAQGVDKFSNSYSSGEVKSVLHWVTIFGERPAISVGADRIAAFAHELLRVARLYDSRCGKWCPPVSECKRGQIEFQTNPLTVSDLLSDFYKRFKDETHPCRLKGTLNPTGRLAKAFASIQSADAKTYPEKPRRALRGLQKNLTSRPRCSSDSSCSQTGCFGIGDAIIAAEQPPSHVLYHKDHSFSALCPILNKSHVLVSTPSLPRAKDDALQALSDSPEPCDP